MKDRAYTVRDIDDLRQECARRWMHGYGGTSITRFSYNQQEMDAAVEGMLRTFLLAGVTAEEIRAEDAGGIRMTATIISESYT